MIPTNLILTGNFELWRELHPAWTYPPKIEKSYIAEAVAVQRSKWVSRRMRAIEILYENGGVMVAEDTQPKVDISELLRHQMQMSMESLWIAWDGRQCLSAYMAALPKHPVVRRILDRISDIRADLSMAKLDELCDIECRKASGVARMEAHVVYGKPGDQGPLIVRVPVKETPSRPKSTIPLPCIRRGAPLESIACPSCHGSTVKIKTFDCISHERCHLSERKLPGVTACRGCSDRVEPTEKVEVLPFASFMNRWPAGTGWIIGRGPTRFDFEDLRKIPENEPVLFINDAVQLEHLVPHRNTFYLALDLPVAQSHYRRITSIYVSGILWNDAQITDAHRVLDCRRAAKRADQMLSWSRETTAEHRQIYRTEGTAICAVHLAWYIGCERLNLIGMDGLTDSRDPNVAYDQRLRQFHSKQPGGIYQKLRAQVDATMAALGVTANYVGTPKQVAILTPQ